jgi:hypothetical protein
VKETTLSGYKLGAFRADAGDGETGIVLAITSDDERYFVGLEPEGALELARLLERAAEPPTRIVIAAPEVIQ